MDDIELTYKNNTNMQITYFGKDNKFAKVSPDEGYKLTSYDEETQDILFFAW